MTKNEIIEIVYDNTSIIKYCKHFTNEWEELKSQLVIQLYNMKYEKLLLAYNNGYLEYMCMTICKRIMYGNVPNTGFFYKPDRFADSIIIEECLEDITNEDEQHQNELLQKIDDILNTLHWYDKTLFEYYYKQGYKLREISDMTEINLKSIHANIKKTKEYIKNKLKQDGIDYDIN